MKIIKHTLLFVLVFTFFSILKSEAQVRIGGGIDVRIELPEIKIEPAPIPRPVPRRAPRPQRPIIINERVPLPNPCDCEVRSSGQIINQGNGGRFDYNVLEGNVNFFQHNELDLIFKLDTGDIMVMSMSEANQNDYNYHFYNNPNGYNNSILNITINNVSVALNSAAVSLQPNNNGGFTAVLNLHSKFNGSFNGTVNSIY